MSWNTHSNTGGNSIRSGSGVQAASDVYTPTSHGRGSKTSGSPRVSVDLTEQTARAPSTTRYRIASPSLTDRDEVDPTRNPGLDPADPGDWLVYHHRKGIVQLLTRPGEPKGRQPPDLYSEESSVSPTTENEYLRVSFAEMQRMYLRKLQIKLVRHAMEMRSSGKEPNDWQSDLVQYSELFVVNLF